MTKKDQEEWAYALGSKNKHQGIFKRGTKPKIITLTYQIGTGGKYTGLIKRHKAKTRHGGPNTPPLTKQQAKNAVEQARKTVQFARDNPEKVVRHVQKTPDWDLLTMIPDYAERFFLPLLEKFDLPTELDSPPWNLEKKVEQIATEKGLPGNFVAGARHAALGLTELKHAESMAKAGNFEKAAVHMGRAGPHIAFIKVAEMEYEWQLGSVNSKSTSEGGKARSKAYSREEYQKDLEAILNRNQRLSLTDAVEQVAKKHGVSDRTVWKYTCNPRQK